MHTFIGLVIYCVVATAEQDKLPSFVVDISGLVTGGSAQEAVLTTHKLDQSFRENGLVIITGHGISLDNTRASFDAAYDLFGLDAAAKSAAAIVNDESSFGRGYLGFGDESGLSSHFEPKEGYSYGSQTVAPQHSLLNIENKWPVGLTNSHVGALQGLYEEEVRVAKTIVGALSTLFNCTQAGPEASAVLGIAASHNGGHRGAHTLADVAEGGELISLMRMFHYFHQQSAIVQEHVQHVHLTQDAAGEPLKATRLLGSSPHTDWGFLTLILADEVGGLQFIPKHGAKYNTDGSLSEDSWVDVPYVPNSLIVNGGDYLKLISGGVYHSPIHRVLSPGTTSSSDADNQLKDRYSFVFFFYPAYRSPLSASVLAHCTHHLSTVTAAHDHASELNTSAAAQARAGHGVADTQPSTVAYNTLLQVDSDGDVGVVNSVKSVVDDTSAAAVPEFGDYVIKKWRGVYRKDS